MKTNKIFLVLMILIPAVVWNNFANAQNDSLRHYLEVAAKNNPGVMAEYSAYQASLQKIPQAGAIPDMQLDMGFYTPGLDIIDGRQLADFTLMQMFPWFGTRKAAQNEAEHLSNAAFERFRESLDNLYLDVYTQWFLMGSLQQKLKNIENNIGFLKQIESLAVRKANISGMSEALRIQMELAGLENDMESIQSEIRAETVQFNKLLNRPAESEVFLPDSLEQIPFELNVGQVMENIGSRNPSLAMISQEMLAVEAKSETDKKMSYPVIGLGLQYSLIGKRTNAGIPVTSMNGMDMIMPMVSATIPLYRNKYKAQLKENEYNLQANRERYDEMYNTFEAELFRIKHNLEDASRKIDLYDRQTNLALSTGRLIIQEYSTGRSDLASAIQVLRQLSDYQLKKTEATAEYNSLAAAVNRLISFSNSNF